MNVLNFSSLMSPNADSVCLALARYISDNLDVPVEFVSDIPWQQREKLLDAGEIHACWICGLPYVHRADRVGSDIELLAAPVMRSKRYQNRPVYFSDTLVLRESRFEAFKDLRGATWAYNEPGSHSGYNLVRYRLAVMGETSGYFGKVIESGAHQNSLQMILDRQIDASAIDSTVLELELQRRPEILSCVRVIETLGPSPIPPWVVLKSLPQKLKEKLQATFLQMHTNPRGRAILAEGQIARFVRVEDSDYDAIRYMSSKAQQVRL